MTVITVQVVHLCPQCLREHREPDGPGVVQTYHVVCPKCANPPQEGEPLGVSDADFGKLLEEIGPARKA